MKRALWALLMLAVHGFSLGGATVLRAAPESGVAAVVEDSAYADLPLILQRQLPEAALWRVEGYEHVGAYAHPEYRQRILGFLRAEVSARKTYPNLPSHGA